MRFYEGVKITAVLKLLSLTRFQIVLFNLLVLSNINHGNMPYFSFYEMGIYFVLLVKQHYSVINKHHYDILITYRISFF